MKINFLGTNGWYDTDTGNTVCVLVETEKYYAVFDAGGGFYKLNRYIKQPKPVHLFLSHYHLDHVIGLHALAKFNFKKGLDVYGAPGLKLLFQRLVNKPFTIPVSELSMPVRLHEAVEGKILAGAVNCAKLKHSSGCYGYRLVADGRTIAYCMDTGVCPNLYKLAQGSDLLISECSLKPGQADRGWGHLSPEDAAAAALKARSRKLALTHFDASLYPRLSDRYTAQRSARRVFKKSFVCTDDMRLEL
jgi:ribonuclease BN (tRNA processing enzyme)